MYFEKELNNIFKLAFPDAKNVFVLNPQNQVIKNFKESGFKYITSRNEIERLAKQEQKYFIINISGAKTFNFPLNFEKIEGIISFNKSVEKTVNYFHNQLFFMRTEAGKIKWLLSEKYRSTDFLLDLESLETVIDIGNVLNVMPATLSYIKVKLGFLKSATNGAIHIYSKNKNLFEGVADNDYTSFSVNFGEDIKNGILTLKLKSKKYRFIILKRALSINSNKLLKKEFELIEELKSKKLKHLYFPEKEQIDNKIVLKVDKNISKSSYHTLSTKYNNAFYSSIIECYEHYMSKISVKEFLKKEKTLTIIGLIKLKIAKKKYPAGLGFMNFIKVVNGLSSILQELDFSIKLTTSLSNNLLVPHNIGCSEDKICFYNWNNAKRKKVILLDILDYIFKYLESFDKIEYSDLQDEINVLLENEIVKQFLSKNNIDFYLHLKIYLLDRLPAELVLLLNKKAIQPEANFKIYFWKELLSKLS
ncbi:MAG: hypothetical protein U9R42_11410 [Bacteroidota bacterium]|nr:hypothetical protein [Bacteroidota bacterium]